VVLWLFINDLFKRFGFDVQSSLLDLKPGGSRAIHPLKDKRKLTLIAGTVLISNLVLVGMIALFELFEVLPEFLLVVALLVDDGVSEHLLRCPIIVVDGYHVMRLFDHFRLCKLQHSLPRIDFFEFLLPRYQIGENVVKLRSLTVLLLLCLRSLLFSLQGEGTKGVGRKSGRFLFC
jgi:hypothetical protein